MIYRKFHEVDAQNMSNIYILPLDFYTLFARQKSKEEKKLLETG